MAAGIKAGAILYDVRGFVLDRVQLAGVSSMNIPQQRIYELGNFSSVATIRDIPDLTYSIESFDVSTELEGQIMGYLDGGTVGPGGTQMDFRAAMPFDVISPFRSAQNAYDIVKGTVTPYLYLETASYKFGVKAESSQTFTFKGDTTLYVPGSPYQTTFNITSGTNQTYTFSPTAIPYTEGGTTFYALGVCAKNRTTGTFKRLFITGDYTDTATTVTPLADLFAAGYRQLDVVWGSATPTTYGTNKNAVVSSAQPGAIRGKDICVYISDGAATPTMVKWDGIQTFDIQYKANLQVLDELCNQRHVGQDFDTTDVTGSIVVRPSDPQNLQNKIAQIANVQTNVVAGPLSSVGLPLEVRINNPDTGVCLKTIYCPDARFTLPGMQGRVNQKAQVTFPFTSDSGIFYVYNGRR